MNPTGVGLGLNIASNLKELLASEREQGIRVTSVPNQGSIFTFFLENKEMDHEETPKEKGLSHSRVSDEYVEEPKTFGEAFFSDRRLSHPLLMSKDSHCR